MAVPPPDVGIVYLLEEGPQVVRAKAEVGRELARVHAAQVLAQVHLGTRGKDQEPPGLGFR